MAYTILKTDGTVLCTIPDGTINTTNSSLGLPGRNYAGYGQILDTNVVHITENFANTSPPANPLTGQLWFDTSANVLRICPADGDITVANWYSVSSTNANGQTVIDTLTVTGNITANNATIINEFTTGNANVVNIVASGNANIATANITNTVTKIITTGGSAVAGNITGTWTLTSGSTLQATYADIAERFASEAVLEPGTVVELGGSKEITAVKYDLSEDVFGVVSNTAAYLLNATAGTDATHPPIAVSGRVLVNVIGTVVKGQRLVSAGNGFARAARPGEVNAFNTIGRSLENKLSEDAGKVLAIVTIR